MRMKVEMNRIWEQVTRYIDIMICFSSQRKSPMKDSQKYLNEIII